MSVNRYLEHVLVIPEDDANRQMANGFLLNLSVDNRRIQVLAEVGGWQEVLAKFETDHAPPMNILDRRFVVLLIDFDEDENRLDKARRVIPEGLMDRVFVLGAWSEPERLREALGRSLESIGELMAEECEDPAGVWNHELLRHNAEELDRIRRRVCPFLFSE